MYHYSSRTTIAVPPGATIKEQLEDRSMTLKEFSQRMEMSEKQAKALIEGKAVLTHDVALRLESVLGIPVKFWSALEASYRESIVRVSSEICESIKHTRPEIRAMVRKNYRTCE